MKKLTLWLGKELRGTLLDPNHAYQWSVSGIEENWIYGLITHMLDFGLAWKAVETLNSTLMNLTKRKLSFY